MDFHDSALLPGIMMPFTWLIVVQAAFSVHMQYLSSDVRLSQVCLDPSLSISASNVKTSIASTSRV